MRYIHGCKPRNPYNMIIQENHVANRATLIIPHFKILVPSYKVEEVDASSHAVNHKIRQDVTKEKN